MQKSEQISEIAKALVLAQSEIKVAKKDSKNLFFKNSYASLESVHDACVGALNKNGIAVTQTTECVGGSTVLVTALLHISGQWISSTYPVHPTKNDPQSQGSALTYARRYSLAAIAGVVTSDDDGEAAMDRGEPAQKQRVIAPKTMTVTRPTPQQLKELYELAAKMGWTDQDILKYLGTLGVTDQKDMTWFQWTTLCKNIKNFPKKG